MTWEHTCQLVEWVAEGSDSKANELRLFVENSNKNAETLEKVRRWYSESRPMEELIGILSCSGKDSTNEPVGV